MPAYTEDAIVACLTEVGLIDNAFCIYAPGGDDIGYFHINVDGEDEFNNSQEAKAKLEAMSHVLQAHDYQVEMSENSDGMDGWELYVGDDTPLRRAEYR